MFAAILGLASQVAWLFLHQHFAAGLINIDAGPIWEDQIAAKLCVKVCRKSGLYWTGHWNTVKESELSVCRCNSYTLEVQRNQTVIGVPLTGGSIDGIEPRGVLPLSVLHVIITVANPSITNPCTVDNYDICNTARPLRDHALDEVREFGTFIYTWKTNNVIGKGTFPEVLTTTSASAYTIQISEAFLLSTIGVGKMEEFQLLYYNVQCIRNKTLVASINIPKGFQVRSGLIRAAFVESYKQSLVTTILPEPDAVFGPGPNQVPVPVSYAHEDFSKTVNSSWFICRAATVLDFGSNTVLLHNPA